jgi:hypothetical protein
MSVLKSREQVQIALDQREPDRIPHDRDVDTQHTLPFGTPDEIRNQVGERMRIFGRGGGFVFNTVHNVQAMIPPENLLAMYNAVREYGGYPLG